jgi:esterase/lipase superfamily enzyme
VCSVRPQYIWGGVPRLGEINPKQEPYRGAFEREGIAVFDLTKLKGRPAQQGLRECSRGVAMIRQRFGEGQHMAKRPVPLVA